jgi:hypothetical protein
MLLAVLVRVNHERLPGFGKALGKGELDRSSVVSKTYCYRDDPAVGFSIWEVGDLNEFEEKFKTWRQYYDEVNVREVITPEESMGMLMQQK